MLTEREAQNVKYIITPPEEGHRCKLMLSDGRIVCTAPVKTCLTGVDGIAFLTTDHKIYRYEGKITL